MGNLLPFNWGRTLSMGMRGHHQLFSSTVSPPGARIFCLNFLKFTLQLSLQARDCLRSVTTPSPKNDSSNGEPTEYIE